MQCQIKDNPPLLVISSLCQFRQPLNEGGFKCECDSKWLFHSLGGFINGHMDERYFLGFLQRGCPTSHRLIATTAIWQGNNGIWEIWDREHDKVMSFNLGEIWIAWLERQTSESKLGVKYIYMNTWKWYNSNTKWWPKKCIYFQLLM